MNAGEFENLQCIVPTGDLPLNIRWSYPGEEMGGSSGVLAKKVADRVSMLMISVITARHAGEYVCTAENAAGTASHSTTLTVNGSSYYHAFLENIQFFVSFLLFFSFLIFIPFVLRFVTFLHNPGKEHRSVPYTLSRILRRPAIENPHTFPPMSTSYDPSFTRPIQKRTIGREREHAGSVARSETRLLMYNFLVRSTVQLDHSFYRSRSMPRSPTLGTPYPCHARS